MKKTIACLLALTLLPSLVFGEAIENDRFHIELKGTKSIVLTERGGSSREFTLDFVVLHNPTNPNMALRGAREVKYPIVSWTAADPAKANLLQSEAGNDMVGDGFDPSILKGGTKGRTTDVFQAAPSFWISPTSHSVTDEGVTFHYNHPLPMLSMLVDYLVTDAHVRSDGRIDFPYNYSKRDYTKVEMAYQTGNGEKRLEKTEFPWGFTVPLSADVDTFTFTLHGHKPDGTVVAITSPTTLKRSATAAEIEAARKVTKADDRALSRP